MKDYLLNLIERMECRDELPKPADASPLEKLLERTVRTEAWKEVREISDDSLISPMCEILSEKKLKAHVFDNGVHILGFIIKNTSSPKGRGFLASLFKRERLNARRRSSLIFASQLASLHEAREDILLFLEKEDYSTLSYAADYFAEIKDKEGVSRISELICERKLGVAQVIKIGNIGEEWVIPLLEKVIVARSGTRKFKDKDCIGYSQRAINKIKS